ncbi:MAG: hypothetical protein AAF962_02500 [Actinomycetota bacterium]
MTAERRAEGSAGRSGERSTERGNALITFLLLAPALVMFLELIVLGGRVAATRADVQAASRQAARQASLAAGPASAAAVIDPVADSALTGKGVRCRSHTVTLGPATDYVQGGAVEVVVTCDVDLSDLDLLGLPGRLTLEASSLEPIEQYRVIE